MPGRRCRCGVAVVRGRVYGVGGFNGSLRVRRGILLIETINYLLLWIGHYYHNVPSLWSLIVYSQVRTVDVYDPTSDSWSSIASMEARRRSQTFISNPCKVFEIQRIGGFIALSWSAFWQPALLGWRCWMIISMLLGVSTEAVVSTLLRWYFKFISWWKPAIWWL